MTCPTVTAWLLEPLPPTPAGLEAHLAGCPRCAALARAHRGALALAAADTSPPALPPVPLAAVRRTVAVRRARRAALGTAAVATLALLLAPRPPPPVPQEAPAGELSLAAAAPAPVSVAELLEEVRAISEPRPPEEDPLYAPFGALAGWVQPPPSRALASPTFQEALAPLFPEEEAP